MTRLFAVEIFLSATLLFMVQPLVGRILLPVLGGSPAVWSTCMVVFQAMLLLGYVYAHVLSSRVPRPWQWPVHLAVLLAASVMLPLTVDIGDPGGSEPRWWTIRALLAIVGLPFFALSATAPLLQHWFTHTGEPQAGDPYFLYAASNAGSLLGLLGYLLLEPTATRSVQAIGWAFGFWISAALVAWCGYATWPGATSARRSPARLPAAGQRPGAAARRPADQAEAGSHTADVSWRRRALWTALALVPSTLLLGVTQHLATDVVSAPLLWVVPLALYLATFIAAFSTRGSGRARFWGGAAGGLALAVAALSLAEIRYPILPVTVVHLAAFTALAMLCHTRLAESRPAAAHITGYFVSVSLGGVLGGVAAALIAPAVFSSILEYPLAIAAAILLRPQTLDADRRPSSPTARLGWRALALGSMVAAFWSVSALDATTAASPVARAALAVPAVVLLLVPRAALLFAGTAAGLLVAGATVRTGGLVLARERTFFGVHQVTSIQNGAWHVLTHGTTTHGVQAVRGRLHSLPTAYYHPSGPIGDLVFTLVADGRFRDVAVVGLGAGALAAYAGSGTRMDFFEIDPAVIRIAEDPAYFTYLADARARPGTRVQTATIDGRLGLRGTRGASYDLIVIDAFSSDTIPAHLLTREAVALYESRLKPRGMIAFHVSSRYFDLAPVVARLAEDRGLVAYARHDREVTPEKAAEAMRPSVWIALARDLRDFGQISHSGQRWVRLAAEAGSPLWTDDYTNLLAALER